MAWVKLDDQFPLNTKTRALSVEARYLFVTSLCWCAMQMNDGTFPASDLPAIAVLADVPPNVAEQLDPALWHPEGFDCEACAEAGQVTPVPSGHISVHCFLERNESRAQIEDRRRRDRNRKKHTGTQGSGRNPPGTPTARNPSVPSRPVLDSDLSSSRPGNSQGTSPPVDNHDVDDGLVHNVPDECWQRYAELKLKAELKRGAVKSTNHTSWKATTRRNARTEHAATAARWLTEFDVTPTQLAACLVDGKPPSDAYRRREPA